MRTNVAVRTPIFTYESAPAHPASLQPRNALRRAVLSCLLWESEFYESGQKIADRILTLAKAAPAAEVAALAREARNVFHLRHAPLLLLVALAETGKGTSLVPDAVADVVRRADEPAELLAIMSGITGKPVKRFTHGIRKGLARAFTRWDAYQLGKYNRDGSVKLRDALFLVHAKPKDDGQADTWRKLVDGTLESPDTWEVGLSAGGDKRETFERLLREGKLGYLALLRNLRNMAQADVDAGLVREAILARKGAGNVLPFRYVAAARAAPQFEPYLDQALSEAVAEMPVFDGETFVLVDVSGSMDTALSSKSDMTRLDAAAALGALVPGRKRVFTFSNAVVEVPPRNGMAGVDTIVQSQPHQGTYLGQAVSALSRWPHDRLIVVTDEQSHDRVPEPVAKLAYMVNVASSQHGVGYGRWCHIDGFSGGVLRYIHASEYDAARVG
jgi:hypothetical protein